MKRRSGKGRRSVPRTPTVEDVAEDYLARDFSRRLTAAHSTPLRVRVERAPLLPLPKPPGQLGPPSPGDSKKLADALREVSRLKALAPAGGRRERLEALVRGGEISCEQARVTLAESEAAFRPLGEKIEAAQRHVDRVRREIRDEQIAAGASYERVLRKARVVLPEIFGDDARVVPFGTRPAPSSRLKPQPPPTKAERSFAQAVVDAAARAVGRENA